jgi:hypothetical protein
MYVDRGWSLSLDPGSHREEPVGLAFFSVFPGAPSFAISVIVQVSESNYKIDPGSNRISDSV